MTKRLLHTAIALLLVLTLILTPITEVNYIKAESDTKYITVEVFAKALAKEIGVTSTSGEEASGYVNALLDKEIIIDGDFTSYSKNITRGDVLVLVSRADEYLNGDTTDARLVQKVIDKRISDISKVSEMKKKDVAKGYIKGYMKGISNGTFCTNRKLKPTSKMTKDGALLCVKMLANKKLRAKISPDGQLIRTTNLPKNAKKFSYILASYPNSYYEKKFCYEGVSMRDWDGNKIELKRGINFYDPVDMDGYSSFNYDGNFKKDKDEYIYEWIENTLSYARLVFNVDYRTIDDVWVQDMLTKSMYNGAQYSGWYQKRLEDYVTKMKKAKTIVKCAKVSGDASSLYSFDDDLYVRIRVRYQIVTTEVPSIIEQNAYINSDPYRSVLFSSGNVDLRGYKAGKWVEGYFDVELSASEVMEKLQSVAGMDINENRMGKK